MTFDTSEGHALTLLARMCAFVCMCAETHADTYRQTHLNPSESISVPVFTSVLIFLSFNLLSFFSPWNFFFFFICPSPLKAIDIRPTVFGLKSHTTHIHIHTKMHAGINQKVMPIWKEQGGRWANSWRAHKNI